MAYFPNGTSGDLYQAQWCECCLNYRDKDDGRGHGCAVWDAHLLSSYGAKGEVKDILDTLIPMDKEGVFAAECAMYLDDGRDHKTLPLFPESELAP